MPTVSIAPATPAEAAELADLIRRFAADLGAAPAQVSTAWVARLIADDAGLVLLARSSGEAVGYLVASRVPSTFSGRMRTQLEDLYVVPGARRQGLGPRLLAALAVWTRQAGAEWIVWSVRDQDGDALRFYARLGAIRDEGVVPHAIDAARLLGSATPTRNAVHAPE